MKRDEERMIGAYDPGNWRLYVLTDERLSRGRPHSEVAREAIRGGADAVQLRDKAASGRALFDLAVQIGEMARSAGVPFIVNDRVDIALAAGADGVHVGQDDLPASAARSLIPPTMILGVSATTPDEATAAERDGADYIGFGPVFEARESKPDTIAPLGLELLREVCRACTVPVIAIGGVDRSNIESVMQAGATGVAVISSVVAADDMAAAARTLKDISLAAFRRRL
ncbi:MAG: thiamine phosphate synthase [Vicinamibacterales bacterium]